MDADPVHHAQRYSGAPALDPVRIVLDRIIFAVFTFQNVVTASRPTPLIWHVTYFAIVGVSWLVIVGQGYWASATSEDG